MSIGIPEAALVDREAVGAELQPALVDLLGLSLNAKQAHWHVTGRHFLPLHEQLDAIAADARAWADLVAERAITVGVAVDGRPDTVAGRTRVPAVGEGFLDGDKVVAAVAEEIEGLVVRLRESAARVGEWDLVTQDVLVEILRGLEKHLWMLQAQLV